MKRIRRINWIIAGWNGWEELKVQKDRRSKMDQKVEKDEKDGYMMKGQEEFDKRAEG